MLHVNGHRLRLNRYGWYQSHVYVYFQYDDNHPKYEEPHNMKGLETVLSVQQ